MVISMGNILDVVVRSIVSLVVLFLITELMGKKQISQLNLFDYIIGISIGSIAASLSVDDSINYIDGALAIVVYGVFATLVSIVTAKSIVLRRFFIGTPLVLMNEGKIMYDNLKKGKIDINDFLQTARENGYYDISELNCSILEPSGRISFLPKSKFLPATPNDHKLKVSENGFVSNLVIDGNIMEKNLKNIGKDEKWLIARLNKMGFSEISRILLVICDNKEQLTVYLKEDTMEGLEVFE